MLPMQNNNNNPQQPPPSTPKGGGGPIRKGRRKINIEYIPDKTRRHVTFSKRKAGIMKKAYELATLTGTQVLLLVASETGHVYTFATPKLQPLITGSEGKNLIQACLNVPDESSNNEQGGPGGVPVVVDQTGGKGGGIGGGGGGGVPSDGSSSGSEGSPINNSELKIHYKKALDEEEGMYNPKLEKLPMGESSVGMGGGSGPYGPMNASPYPSLPHMFSRPQMQSMGYSNHSPPHQHQYQQQHLQQQLPSHMYQQDSLPHRYPPMGPPPGMHGMHAGMESIHGMQGGIHGGHGMGNLPPNMPPSHASGMYQEQTGGRQNEDY